MKINQITKNCWKIMYKKYSTDLQENKLVFLIHEQISTVRYECMDRCSTLTFSYLSKV